jgi:hypothetical protein
MKSPRDYYPPQYLAEQMRTKQASMKREQTARAGQVTVQRLSSGCLLYRLQPEHSPTTGKRDAK